MYVTCVWEMEYLHPSNGKQVAPIVSSKETVSFLVKWYTPY